MKWCVFVLVFFLGGGLAQANSTVNYQYYDLYASDGPELLRQIARQGSNGFAAHTDWRISYEFTTSKRGGNCRLVGTKVNLNIDYLMPKWKNEAFADLALQSRWKSWNKNLLKHEQQHGAHGEAAYAAINSQFAQVSAESDCETIRVKLADIVDQVLAEQNAKDIELDRLTQHGTTQGAAQINLLDEEDRVPAIAAAMEAKEWSPLKWAAVVLGGLTLLVWIRRRYFG
ncbi:MAG: DUF922 domain-containing protein [Granulosicoccus sp.]